MLRRLQILLLVLDLDHAIVSVLTVYLNSVTVAALLLVVLLAARFVHFRLLAFL